MIQMQPPRCSVKKVFWQISKKYTGKHQGLFFNKVAGIKTSLGQVFSCEFCEIFKNTFFTEHLWTTASGNRSLNYAGWGWCLLQIEDDVFKTLSHVHDGDFVLKTVKYFRERLHRGCLTEFLIHLCLCQVITNKTTLAKKNGSWIRV